MNMKMTIYKDLEARGLLNQCTHPKEIQEHLESEMRSVYCGFDPTADSLHIGNLVPLLVLKRFQKFGHRPIILIGSATGLIGDPSGRSEERKMNSVETVNEWVLKLQHQTSPFVDFNCGKNSALAVDNFQWIGQLNVIDFFRDTGKFFSVNSMLSKESVKNRIGTEEQGISFTEFSYSIMQAYDFKHLYQNNNCTIQIGGSDQWGNITAGMDLIRKTVDNSQAFGLTLPLITKSDGTKFGKSAGGAVWLDARKTSPFQFYQFWINTDDADVENFLKYFTFLELHEIMDLLQKHLAEPEKRLGQKILAQEVTKVVHGEKWMLSAERITDVLFGGDVDKLTEEDFAQLQNGSIPTAKIESSEIGIIDMLTKEVCSSKREAREFLNSGAISINGVKMVDVEKYIQSSDSKFGKYLLVRKGKKSYYLMVFV
jgi:tyrosyl-tRNA synthetase